MTSPIAEISPRRSFLGVLVFLLCLLTVLAHGRTLLSEFVVLDDEDYVLANAWVQGGLSSKGMAWAFSSVGYASNWHPATWISHMADVSLYGLKPMGHHLTSLALHVANSLLLFLFLRSLTGAVWRSFLVAALFGVHPLQVESVAWVAQRKSVLAAFFMLLALLAWVRFIRVRSKTSYVACHVMFALGAMSKATVVAMPILLLLLDWWPLGRMRRGYRSWGIVGEKSLLIVIAAASAFITYLAQQRGGATQAVDLPYWAKTANALVAYASYPAMALFPRNLAVFYPHPGMSVSLWKLSAAVASLITASILGYRWRRNRPHIIVGWLWYVALLAPVSGFLQIGWQSLADRYIYLPLIGLCVAASWCVADGVAMLPPVKKDSVVALAVLCLLVLTMLSSVQTGYWRNSKLLFQHAIAVTGANWLAEHSLGVTSLREGHLSEAETLFRRVTSSNPTFDRAFNNLGVVLLQEGRELEAVPILRRAVELNPRGTLTRFNYALSLETSDPRRSVDEYRRVLAEMPDLQQARIRLAMILHRLGSGDP